MGFQKSFFVLVISLFSFSLALGQDAPPEPQPQVQKRTIQKRVVRRQVASTSSGDLPLAYTHILPSTAVIPNGQFVIGTSAGFGLFDFIDFSTNLVLDIEQVFNATSKIALYHDHDFAFAPNVTFETQTFTATDPNTGIQTSQNSTAWFPGATFSYRLTSNVVAHTGGMIAIRNPPIPKSSVQNPRTSLIQGNTLNQEFTFGITRGFALATGASYDLTYDIWGAGASVYISNFHIGGQYYFNVGQGNLLPIIGVAYGVTF